MYRRLTVSAAAVFFFCTATLLAQEATLSQVYGRGVHAYFSQDYRQAYEYFTSAIDGGSQDPRCWYFRGLTYLQLGRQQEAEMDFQKGGELEAQDVNKFYNVSRALERIQGNTRITLERYRAKARLAAMQQAEKLRALRYEQIRRQEARVLEEQAEAAAKTPPELPKQPAPPKEAVFGAGPLEEKPAAQPAKPPAKEPAKEAVPQPAENPFAPEPGKQLAPPPEDPFAPKPAKTPAAPAAEDPFAPEAAAKTSGGGVLGAVGKALGKAVGIGQKPGEPAPADDPFAVDAPADQPPGPAESGKPLPADPFAEQ